MSYDDGIPSERVVLKRRKIPVSHTPHLNYVGSSQGDMDQVNNSGLSPRVHQPPPGITS